MKSSVPFGLAEARPSLRRGDRERQGSDGGLPIAAKTIKDAGLELKGDLLISAVVGEIGTEPVDEFSSARYLSKEAGARYLIQHGGVADFALIAEGTSFAAGWIEAGKAFFKVTVHGDRQYYTPFTPDAEVDETHPNAIVRAGFLIPRIQQWRIADAPGSASCRAHLHGRAPSP